MKYDYIVKSGGVYYAAGKDVPEETVNVETETEPDRSKMDMEELTFSDTDIHVETEPARRGRPRKSDM